MSNTILESEIFENVNALLKADISTGIYLPRLTKNIFLFCRDGEFLKQLTEAKKVMKKAFNESKKLLVEAGYEVRYFDQYSPAKLLITIKTYAEQVSNPDYDEFTSLIEKGAFHYTSTKSPVETYFNLLKSDETEQENIITFKNLATDEKTDEKEVKEVKEKTTDFDKAKKLVNNIKNLDLTFDEIEALCQLLKQC